MATDYSMNELDDSLSGMDIELDMPATSTNENSVIREKLLNIKAGLESNLAETPTDKSIANILKNSVPSMLGSNTKNMLSDMTDTLKNEAKSFKQALADNGAGDILDFIKEKLPKDSSFKDKLDKVKNSINSEKTVQQGSTEKSASMLSEELFSAIDNTAHLKANTEMAALASMNTSKENNALLVASKHNFNLSRYTSEIAESYYKKSIELKYKSLFTLKEIANTLKISSLVNAKGLQDVTHNSSLSTMGKASLAQLLSMQLKTRAISSLYDKGTRKYSGPMDIFKNKLSKKTNDLKNKATGFLGMASGLKESASMMDGMGDMGFEMTEEEKREMSKEAMLAGMAVDEGKGFLSRIIGGKAQETKLGNTIFGGLENIVDNPYGFLKSKSDNLKVGGSARAGVNALAEMFNPLNDDSESYLLSDKKRGLNDIADFDNRTQISITKVIPTLLARISAGVNKGEEVKYDYSKGKFVKASGVKSIIGKDIKARYIKENHGAISKTVMKGLNKNNNLSKEDKEDLLIRLANHKGNLDIRYVNENSSLFEGLDAETKERYLKSFTTLADSFKGNKSLYPVKRFNQLLTGISENKVDSRARIQDLIDAGFGEELLESGIIEEIGINGKIRIAKGRYKELNDLAILNAYNGEDEINAPITKEDVEDTNLSSTATETISEDSSKDIAGFSIIDSIVSQSKGYMNKVSESADTETAITVIDEIKKTSLAKLSSKEYLLKGSIKVLPNGMMRKKADDLLNHIKEQKKTIIADSEKLIKKMSSGSYANDINLDGNDKPSSVVEEALLNSKKDDVESRNKLSETITKLTEKLTPKKTKFFDKDGDGDRDNSWQDIFSNKKKKATEKDILKAAKKNDKKGKSSGGLLGMLKYAIPLLGGIGSMAVSVFKTLGKLDNVVKGLFSFLGGKGLAGIITAGSALGGLASKAGAKVAGFIASKGGVKASLAFAGKRVLSFLGPVQSAYFGYKAVEAFANGDGAAAAIYATGAATSLLPNPLTSLASAAAVEAGLAALGPLSERKSEEEEKAKVDKAVAKHYQEEFDIKQAAKKAKKDKIKKGKISLGNDVADFIMTTPEMYKIEVTAGGKVVFYRDIKTNELVLTISTNSKGVKLRQLSGSIALSMGVHMLGEAPKEKDEKINPSKSETGSKSLTIGDSSDITMSSAKGSDITAKNSSDGVSKDSMSTAGNDGSSNIKPSPIDDVKTIKANKAKIVKGVSEGDKILFEAISEYESKKGAAGYNIVYGNGKYTPKGTKLLTSMAIAEVFDFQDKLLRNQKGKGSTAVGKFQFIKGTLKEVVRGMGISVREKFTANTQDRLILYRLNQLRHYKGWKAGSVSDEKFIHYLSMEFASIVSPVKGKGYYDGDGLNHANNSVANMKSVLKKVREKLGILATSSTYASMSKDDTLASSADPSSSGSSSGLMASVESSIKSLLEFFGVKFDSDSDDNGNNNDSTGNSGGSTTRTPSANYSRDAANKTMEDAAKGDQPILSNRASKIRYASLCPEAKAFVLGFSKYANTLGLKLQIPRLGGSRTYADQEALYAQGRNGNKGKIVTWTKTNSYHIGGRAVDIISAKGYGDQAGNTKIAHEMRKYADSHRELGATFLSLRKDPNHVQFTGADMLDPIVSAEDMVNDKNLKIGASPASTSEDKIVKKHVDELNKAVNNSTPNEVVSNSNTKTMLNVNAPRSLEDMVANNEATTAAEVNRISKVNGDIAGSMAGKLDVEHMVKLSQNKLEEINSKQLAALHKIADNIKGVKSGSKTEAEQVRALAENKSSTSANKTRDYNKPDIIDSNPIDMSK